MTENLTPEPCTSWSTRRRHFSTQLEARGIAGRMGVSLCGTRVYDQATPDTEGRVWPGFRGVVIADLPVCKLCARKTGGAS